MTTHADNLAAALKRVYDDVSDLSPETYGLVSEALEAHAAHTFAHACRELADRARAVSGGNPGLWPSDQNELRQLELYAHSVGDAADSLPDLYVEPRA